MSEQLPQQRLTVPGDVDETEFYSTDDGSETLVTHADLEEAVPNSEKPHLREMQRYWVNKPYSFVVIYRNVRDSELRYIAVEPRLTDTERDIVQFFRDKLRTSIDYDNVDVEATPTERSQVVRDETLSLMKRYNLLKGGEIGEPSGIVEYFKQFVLDFLERQADRQEDAGVMADEDDPLPRNPSTGEIKTLDSTQVRRILYYLVRDFIRFDRIDPIKQDVNIEDISCDGYNSPIFVYHSEYGQQVVTNIRFGVDDLDSFVKRLAQSAGKGISRRQPSLDATLSDGSRAQLTLGTETSDRGTNFTIRQFNDIPFTPVDLLNWKTFNIDQMAYLWLAIQNNKSIVFAGGTASGKTTSLNAVSLFMPSTAKIVSIEDTRELEIPQANWVPRTTRESFQEDESGTIDEFDLLEDALRQRPDYVIMGEVRGEEGQTLFQMLNTGHTTYTTFHANKPREVIRRFTTDPINVSPSMFDALDIICMQESVDMNGTKVRRAREIVEIDDYNATRNQFSMNDAFTWDRKQDRFRRKGKSQIIEEIQEENAWSDQELREEWNKRRIVLSYLVLNNINTYAGVAATLQAYMSSPDTILALISNDELRTRIAALHQMQTVNIDVDPEKEALIPRPRTPAQVQEDLEQIMDEHEGLLTGYDGGEVDFAQTIDEMLTDETLSDSDKAFLNKLSDDNTAGQLPEGVDEEVTDATGTAGGGDALELDEELDALFEDDSDEESGDQMILTSETLEKLNQDVDDTPSEEPTDNDTSSEDSSTESDSGTGAFDDLFDEDGDEDDVEPTDDAIDGDDSGFAFDDEDSGPIVAAPGDSSDDDEPDPGSESDDGVGSHDDADDDDVDADSAPDAGMPGDTEETDPGMDDPLSGEESIRTVDLDEDDDESGDDGGMSDGEDSGESSDEVDDEVPGDGSEDTDGDSE